MWSGDLPFRMGPKRLWMRRRESSLRDRAMTLIVYAESRQMGRRTRSRFSDVSSRSMTYKAKRRNLARTKPKPKVIRGRRWGLVDEDFVVVLKSHRVSHPDPFFAPYRSPALFFALTQNFRVREDTVPNSSLSFSGPRFRDWAIG